jgi:hypothetical protein
MKLVERQKRAREGGGRENLPKKKKKKKNLRNFKQFLESRSNLGEEGEEVRELSCEADSDFFC